MKIAFLGTIVNNPKKNLLSGFFKILHDADISCCFLSSFYDEVENEILKYWSTPQVIELGNLPTDIKCFVSIGGDGTMINSAKKIVDMHIPIIGVNFGNLGFLTSIAIEHFKESLHHILNGNYVLENRKLLQVFTQQQAINQKGIALNEISFHKYKMDSVIAISVYVDNILANTYWADGLIVATPTGSTAYNVSCGGPIIYPTTPCFAITPIASHNLNVRPLIISNNMNLRIQVTSRLEENFIMSLDADRYIMPNKAMVEIKAYPHEIQFIQLPQATFLNTIRQKLHWGVDIRN